MERKSDIINKSVRLEKMRKLDSFLSYLDLTEVTLVVLRVLWCRESPTWMTFLPAMLNCLSR